MNAKIHVMILALVCLIGSSVFAAPAFAHSSAFESNTVIGTDCSTIDIIEDGTTYESDIANTGISGSKYTSGQNTLYRFSGTVSKDLSILITGSTDSKIQVRLDGASSDITVKFAFEGSDDITLGNGTWNGTTSRTYTAGSTVGFTVTVSADASSTNAPTLGTVTFTMVGSGSSVSITSNPVTVSLGQIINDEDVKIVLGNVNRTRNDEVGVTGTTNTNNRNSVTDFRFVENTEDEDINGVFITAGSNNNVVDKKTSFVFDVKIPAGQKFCIRIDVSTLLLADNEVTVTATSESKTIYGTASLKSAIVSSDYTYIWIENPAGDRPSLTSGSDKTCTAFDEMVTLHFDGKRTAGILNNGSLKIQIVMDN